MLRQPRPVWPDSASCLAPHSNLQKSRRPQRHTSTSDAEDEMNITGGIDVGSWYWNSLKIAVIPRLDRGIQSLDHRLMDPAIKSRDDD
ncbi:MAG: hypothetical protein CMI00_14960 [Oceanospirillaceae bacterium]|nr:hypothetical protein [Oceanospirillaceae bacterium]